MDIKEIIKAKEKLESDISQLFKQFYNKTGLEIDDILYQKDIVACSSNPDVKPIIFFDVKVKLTL